MDYVTVSLYVLAALLVGALLWMGKSLFEARAQLKLEEGRRANQDALNDANQKALTAQCETLKSEFRGLAAELLSEKQQKLADGLRCRFGEEAQAA